MSKISIVGVDGSGKTVLMAAFGEKYERPDKHGYFLSANTIQTFNIVKTLMDRMRKGYWPNATGVDTMTNLEWTLQQRKGKSRETICSISFLDYAGEIYRLAFGNRPEEERIASVNQIHALYDHISSSDALLVLINLKDVISGDLSQVKTRETLWISRSIFDYATEKNPNIKIALAFSQFDVYRDEVDAVGGLQAAYREYLSHIECLYPEMQLFALSAVNKTVVNADGFEVPAPDFESEGLDTLLDWIASIAPISHKNESAEKPVKRLAKKKKLICSLVAGIGLIVVIVAGIIEPLVFLVAETILPCVTIGVIVFAAVKNMGKLIKSLKVKQMCKFAERGDASAQCYLGFCYANGDGVSQDYNEAAKWYRKAADQGNVKAQHNLGECYKSGRGVSKNYDEAVKWYRKAAQGGNVDARSWLESNGYTW